jgi:hypothetical protein
MSDFPQMPKRSLELPFGCKDLIDVETIRNWKPVADRVRPFRATIDRLAYVEGQIAELLRLGGTAKLVSVSRHHDHGQLMVISDPDLSVSAVFAHWRDAHEEEALRKVFEEQGISSITGPVGGWKTKDALRYILPSEPLDAARLIGQVFCNGYGLGALAEVNLSYHERKRA